MTLCPYQFFQDTDVQLTPTKMFLMMMFIILFFWGTSCHFVTVSYCMNLNTITCIYNIYIYIYIYSLYLF